MKKYIGLILLCLMSGVVSAAERHIVGHISKKEKEALVREMALDAFWGKLSVQKTCKARCLKGYTRENIDAAEKSPIASCLDSCVADFLSFEKVVRKNQNASVPKQFLPEDNTLARTNDGALYYKDYYDYALEAVVKGRIASIKDWENYWLHGQRFVSGPEHFIFIRVNAR